MPLEFRAGVGALIGVGGGKDSIVTYELLKKQNIPLSAFVLETQKNYQLINEGAEKMGETPIRFKRKLDPLLFDKSRLPGSYNGHIPITSIYSVVALLCAVLYDYRFIVMSNEKSANE